MSEHREHAGRPAALSAWHAIVEARDPARVAEQLDALLAEECVFRSPAVHAPQEGKAVTTAYLTAAMAVLGPTLRYREEWINDGSAVLEFEAEVADRTVHGVDLLRWDDADRLTSFTVMVRPLRGLEALIEAMGRELAR